MYSHQLVMFHSQNRQLRIIKDVRNASKKHTQKEVQQTEKRGTKREKSMQVRKTSAKYN